MFTPLQYVRKRAFWNELINLKNNWSDGVWVVAVDFNAVRKMGEIKGRNNANSGGSLNEMLEFNVFIDNMRLQDIPLIGQAYTWYRAGGGAKSIIGRILVSQEWLQKRPMSSQYTINIEISNHYPFILKYNQQDWGPKPFKVINTWFLVHGFQSWVKEEYRKLSVQG